jgi:hypothetical protein
MEDSLDPHVYTLVASEGPSVQQANIAWIMITKEGQLILCWDQTNSEGHTVIKTSYHALPGHTEKPLKEESDIGMLVDGIPDSSSHVGQHFLVDTALGPGKRDYQ